MLRVSGSGSGYSGVKGARPRVYLVGVRDRVRVRVRVRGTGAGLGLGLGLGLGIGVGIGWRASGTWHR